nr:hypothetical protein CFP56_34906 [Quercus suber]
MSMAGLDLHRCLTQGRVLERKILGFAARPMDLICACSTSGLPHQLCRVACIRGRLKRAAGSLQHRAPGQRHMPRVGRRFAKQQDEKGEFDGGGVWAHRTLPTCPWWLEVGWLVSAHCAYATTAGLPWPRVWWLVERLKLAEVRAKFGPRHCSYQLGSTYLDTCGTFHGHDSHVIAHHFAHCPIDVSGVRRGSLRSNRESDGFCAKREHCIDVMIMPSESRRNGEASLGKESTGLQRAPSSEPCFGQRFACQHSRGVISACQVTEADARAVNRGRH